MYSVVHGVSSASSSTARPPTAHPDTNGVSDRRPGRAIARRERAAAGTHDDNERDERIGTGIAAGARTRATGRTFSGSEPMYGGTGIKLRAASPPRTSPAMRTLVRSAENSSRASRGSMAIIVSPFRKELQV